MDFFSLTYDDYAIHAYGAQGESHGINGGLIQTLEGHTDFVNSVAFSSDGSMMASGSDDDTVILWGHTRP